jgi:hypothetical protein
VKLRTYGDTRTDGKRFSQYQKTTGGAVREIWMSPEAWTRINAARVERNRLSKRRKAAERRAAGVACTVSGTVPGVACTAADSAPTQDGGRTP